MDPIISLEARHPRNHPHPQTRACYSGVELGSESSNGSKVKLLETTFHPLGRKHLSIDQVIASTNLHTDIQIWS